MSRSIIWDGIQGVSGRIDFQDKTAKTCEIDKNYLNHVSFRLEGSGAMRWTEKQWLLAFGYVAFWGCWTAKQQFAASGGARPPLY